MKDFSKFGTLLTKEDAKKIKGGKNCPICDCYPCICPDGGGGGGECNWGPKFHCTCVDGTNTLVCSRDCCDAFCGGKENVMAFYH